MKRFLLALMLTCPAVPVWAQGANPGVLPSPGQIGPAGKPTHGLPPEKAPSALPGARAEPTEVAPITRNAIDLPPNEALFDAINRGDLAVAKDAVNRGADLNGTNVLGLTPIELAVDLGRNQISFYLLSLRGGIAGESPTGPPPDAAAAKPLSRAERLAAQRAEKAQRIQSAVADPLPATPRTARLFAGNGGAPVPSAGFLGFDAAH